MTSPGEMPSGRFGEGDRGCIDDVTVDVAIADAAHDAHVSKP